MKKAAEIFDASSYCKDTLKKYEELWSKIRYIIRSITNKSHDYDEKYMKVKFHSDDDTPLRKTVKLHNMIMVVKSIFHEYNILHASFLRWMLV